MAGKILRKQYAVLGLTQGMVEMMWAQRYRDQKNNKTFSGARERLSAHCDWMHTVFSKEGGLRRRDIDAIKKRIDALSRAWLPGGEFSPMLAISFCIDLVVEQIVLTKGNKKRAFEGLLTRIKEFERYFDRAKSYDDPAGMEMADAFRQLTV